MSGDGFAYYDVRAILSEETDVPVTFTTGVVEIGKVLDPSAGEKDLLKGTKTKLPLWLVLVMWGRHMVQIRSPGVYGQKMRRKMQAGAEVEDMRIRAPFFYDVAARLQPMLHESIASFVSSVFRSRYKALLTKAHTMDTGPDTLRLLALLSNEEKLVFEAGRVSIAAFDRWRVDAWATRRPAVKRRAKENAPGNGNQRRGRP